MLEMTSQAGGPAEVLKKATWEDAGSVTRAGARARQLQPPAAGATPAL